MKQDKTGQITVEDIDGGLCPAVDGQHLDNLMLSESEHTSYKMYCFLHSGVMWAPRCSANFILTGCPLLCHTMISTLHIFNNMIYKQAAQTI